MSAQIVPFRAVDPILSSRCMFRALAARVIARKSDELHAQREQIRAEGERVADELAMLSPVELHERALRRGFTVRALAPGGDCA